MPEVLLKVIPRMHHLAYRDRISVVGDLGFLVGRDLRGSRLVLRHTIFLAMSDQQSDDQRRDALLVRLLRTPPKPRPKRERIINAKERPATKGRVHRAKSRS